MKITHELILEGQSENGGWNKPQLALIGVDWPPRAGWKWRVIGNYISQEDAAEFIARKGKKRRDTKTADWLMEAT